MPNPPSNGLSALYFIPSDSLSQKNQFRIFVFGIQMQITQ
jgi:hypothetical protein